MTNDIPMGTWFLFGSSFVIGWLAVDERATHWRVAYVTLGLMALLIAVRSVVKLG